MRLNRKEPGIKPGKLAKTDSALTILCPRWSDTAFELGRRGDRHDASQWLLTQRVARAQHLLENTDLPLESVAEQAGFGSATTLCQRFASMPNTWPSSYRREFRGV